MKKNRDVYLTREKAELLLSNLQRLRTEISDIEAQYDILEANYAQICEDAISKISVIKTDIEQELESTIGDADVIKAEISHLEARFELGLMPAETYKTWKRLLEGDTTPKPKGLQAVNDKVADCIEFGLDRIGDGIIFLIEKIVNSFTVIFRIFTSIFKNIVWKAMKRRHA